MKNIYIYIYVCMCVCVRVCFHFVSRDGLNIGEKEGILKAQKILICHPP